jgi:hypothetical protein
MYEKVLPKMDKTLFSKMKARMNENDKEISKRIIAKLYYPISI